jgi:hypothetical protein
MTLMVALGVKIVGAIIKKQPKVLVTLACSLVATLSASISFSVSFTIGLGYRWTYFIFFLPPFGFVSAMVTLVFGLPLFFLGLKFDLVKWWSALVSGFIVGDLVVMKGSWPHMPHLSGIFGMGMIGALSAFGFWVTWAFLAKSPRS